MIPDPANLLMDDQRRAALLGRSMPAEVLGVTDFDARFAAVTDMVMRIVWADHYRLDPADPQLHSSAPARRAAMLLMHAAGLEGASAGIGDVTASQPADALVAEERGSQPATTKTPTTEDAT